MPGATPAAAPALNAAAHRAAADSDAADMAAAKTSAENFADKAAEEQPLMSGAAPAAAPGPLAPKAAAVTSDFAPTSLEMATQTDMLLGQGKTPPLEPAEARGGGAVARAAATLAAAAAAAPEHAPPPPQARDTMVFACDEHASKHQDWDRVGAAAGDAPLMLWKDSDSELINVTLNASRALVAPGFPERHTAGEDQGPIPLAVYDGNHMLPTALPTPIRLRVTSRG